MSEYETRGERAALEAELAELEREDVSTSTKGVSVPVSVRFRGEELETVEQAATAAGMKLSTFIRQAALGAATPVDVRAASGAAEEIQAQVRRLLALLHGEKVA